MVHIRRQSVLGSVFAILGVGIGFLNSGFLQPKLLTTDEIGILRYFISLSGIVASLASLGMPPVLIKYIPLAKSAGYEGKLHRLFVLFLGIGLLLGLGFLIIYLNYFQDKLGPEWYGYVYQFYVITFLLSTSISWLDVHGLTSKSIFARDVVIKLGFVTALAALYFFGFSFESFLYLIEAVYVLGVFFLLYSVFTKKIGLKLKKVKTRIKLPFKSILSLAGFSVIYNSINFLKREIDILMVAHLMSFSATGIYAIMMFFAVLVEVPGRGLNAIAPIRFGQLWAQKDMNALNSLYHKTSQNQLIIAGFVYVSLLSVMPVAFEIMPNGTTFSAGYLVVVWLGLAHFTQLGFGDSGRILYYSDKYRYNFYFTTLMLIMVVGLNWYFIPKYGLSGAGFATFLSQLFLNIIRWHFLKRHFALQPFNNKSLRGFSLFLLTLGYAWIIHIYADIENVFLKSALAVIPICIIYFTLIRYTDIALDLKERVETYLSKVRERLP
ncbi:MAG: polysaccharide biosynthesis C-terminal domain-containing protein [Cryomorphaceae bacterium]|nr:polysaccharide biosynthesis C-terminal domain-containing protein [Flavobacteriales bacterium]